VISLRRDTSAISASTPPSPRLSARITTTTYFSVTTTISAQVISDRMPSTSSGTGFSPVNSLKHSFTV
jgi:hypothetical protein